jgi:hypothetical protein
MSVFPLWVGVEMESFRVIKSETRMLIALISSCIFVTGAIRGEMEAEI